MGNEINPTDLTYASSRLNKNTRSLSFKKIKFNKSISENVRFRIIIESSNSNFNSKETKFLDFTKKNLKQITHINLDGFDKLTKLDLSSNLIESLTNQCFRNCTKLTDLKLHENKIKQIDEDIFAPLVKL